MTLEPLIDTMNSRRTTSWLRRILCLGILAALTPSTSLADQALVDIEPSDFNPQVVTINPGDDVVWTWVSDAHNTQGSFWDSGIFNTGYVYTNNFPDPGTFPYICIVHGFDGTVIVQTNTAPIVTITSPANGASFTPPANVPIVATASDPNNTVTNVAFFDGVTFLGQTNDVPYTVTANLTNGSHSLTAVATDNLGLSATSSVVTIFVSTNPAPSVTMTNPVDGAVLPSSAALTIRVSTIGSITNVRFFDGALVLGNDATPAFTFNGTFSIGPHSFSAVAFDNVGRTATSAVINV